MVACRADLGSLRPNVQMAAVEALPYLYALALKDLALLDALGQLEVALLVGLLDGADQLELGRDLVEAGLEPGPLFTEALACAHKLRLAGRPKEEQFKYALSLIQQQNRKT